MQYDLERAYHVSCQQAAAQRRGAAEVDRHSSNDAWFSRCVGTLVHLGDALKPRVVVRTLLTSDDEAFHRLT